MSVVEGGGGGGVGLLHQRLQYGVSACDIKMDLIRCKVL